MLHQVKHNKTTYRHRITKSTAVEIILTMSLNMLIGWYCN